MTQVRAKLAPLMIQPDEADEIKAVISQIEAKESGTITDTIKKTTSDLVTIQEKLDRLTRSYLNPEEGVDGDSFHTIKTELIREKTRLKAEKERLQKKRVNSWIEPSRDAIKSLQTLATMPDTASPHEIAENLRKFGTNPVLANKTVTFSFGEPYNFLPCLLASARSASHFLASKRCGDFNQNLQSSRWRPYRESNPLSTLRNLSKIFILTA